MLGCNLEAIACPILSTDAEDNIDRSELRCSSMSSALVDRSEEHGSPGVKAEEDVGGGVLLTRETAVMR